MLRDRITHTRLCLGALVVLAVLAPLPHIAAADDQRVLDRAPRVVADSRASASAHLAPPRETVEVGSQVAAGAAPPAGVPVLVTEPDAGPADAAPVAATVASRPSAFAERHAPQLAAVQDPADPATTRWALLIGINEHLGGVSDNIGSRQDAEALRAHLLANGWRDDHILLLTDRAATGAAIRDGLRWLADKTDESSVAVFHYSGHSKKWRGVDRDGDGEVTDEGLWPTDDDFIVDSDLVALLDPVRPSAFWISFASCNAAGFADPGLAQPGRVLTFSSGEPQKSYEHPSWGHSVWGWFLIEQGMRAGLADLDGNGRVGVEEAWTWARPHAIDTTRSQRYGSQDAVIVDQLDGELHLGIPGAPPPAPTGRPDPRAGEPAPAPEQPAPQPEPDQDPDRHGGYLCVLCGGR